ncbi:sodium-dependent serotonin transporter [Anopheles gambiae]|uniref:sodium-dependent serotonin transporter n=1 Tax=Anopheles gambiae TaxID=7165 RepID=UPI002AC8AC65|nr:sodium-dependent serotonin transporter [Anopheles gambiae]XP_061516457.1 sodium-dependent serotonin transporter [Anopheles gambiae]XP_061516458.1 sodium-dependent serotonin transporter [Anopheles gambiae]XP_061516459.1 sodium-dependent serotonin transporter [Anopheles gambiae]
MGTEPGTTNSSGSGGSGSRGAKKRDSWHTAAAPGTNGTSTDGGHGEPPDTVSDTAALAVKEAAPNGSSATSKPTHPATTETAQVLQSGKERSLVVALTGERRRETWSQKAEFLLAVIGFAVDLGNVWRFPYICYQNGGGAFLIPYCIMLLFGGLPLFYMELALGQFHRCGCLSIWKRICPALKGVGYAICLIDIYMGMYYNTIIGWAVYYLFASFSSELPWTKCGNPWNTENCSPVTGRVNETVTSTVATATTTAMSSMSTGAASAGVTLVASALGNSTMGTTHSHYYQYEHHLLSSTLPTMLSNLTTSTMATVAGVVGGASAPALSSPAREFFERQVLEQYKSNGLDFMGPVKPSLALCVFGVFVLVYFSLWKGVRSAGKVVWVTALAPYVVLLILLARGVTLPGAAEGIRYYLTPQWDKLNNSRVWIDAASQIFFSLGPGFGTLLALSSYNKFNNNCYRDALLTSSINCLTSFLAGFVIFSVLGYMAQVQNKSIEEVGLEGPGLVFIVYPEAIAMMKGSVFWSIIFFLMLITLGLDSTFGGLEAMITALCDEYPRTIGRRRELFVLILLGLIYICALPTMTYGGVYLVNFLNVYGPGLAILFVVFVEAAGVFWFYGVENFSADIEQMLGKKPSLFWRICWKYISPTFLFCILIFSLLGYEEMLGEEYEYPEWSVAAGWALTLSSVLCIPTYMVYKFLISPGNCNDRLRRTFKPEPLIPTAIPGQLYTGTAV